MVRSKLEFMEEALLESELEQGLLFEFKVKDSQVKLFWATITQS